MKHIYKMEEWQSGSGNWYCNDTSDLGKGSGLWWHPARILGMTAADFITLLVKEYHVDNIQFNNILIYSWKKQSDMRKFKNFINKKAREASYMIGE